MKRNQKVRISVDMAMIVTLPLLMAYSMVGEALHEYLGIVMFILFIFHNLLNITWWKNLLKGRYTAARILKTAINILLIIIMAALFISGIMMSRYVFSFLDFEYAVSLARTVHLLASYWGFALMSIHVGLHGKMFVNMAKKVTKTSRDSKNKTLFLNGLAVCIFVYGLYAFINRQFASYMFLATQFVFFDFAEPLILFMIDYIFIMLMFAFVGYYLLKLLQNHK